MEECVGIFFINMLVFVISLSGVEWWSIKHNIKQTEKGKEQLQTYGTSLLLFSAIAVFLLISLVVSFSRVQSDSTLVKSGLLFAILSILFGTLIRFIYNLLIKLAEFILKTSVLYKLNDDEVKWIFLLICFGLMCLCFQFNMHVCAYTYLVLIIGKLLWLDVSIQNLKKELDSLKNLSRSFWYVVIFIIVCIFSASRYTELWKSIISQAGIVLGGLVGIYCIYLIDKKFENYL